MSENAEETAAPEPMRFEVTGGNPSDDEMAAVLTVLAAALTPTGPAKETDDRPLAGGWKSYQRVIRRMPPPGRAAWQYSARP
ncbi:acyl-CoA carboxylase epsilon subunit [Luteococcus sp. OSA5]|uniref:acyl-CoA carboxylase epsilon subunit n=1 Tax=Luteococcus sp. OSA5 TaxID=3401630 RepID=UPI003B42F464